MPVDSPRPVGSPLLANLSELRPEAVALLTLANDCARQTVDPDLLDLLQARIDTLIGEGSLSQDILVDSSGDSADLTASYIVAAAFAEQFIIDVSGITDADRESLAVYFPGEAMREFITALYILECTYRLSLIAEMLFADNEDSSITIDFAKDSVDSTERPNIRGSLKDYQDAVLSLGGSCGGACLTGG